MSDHLDFERFRRDDLSIDLKEAWEHYTGDIVSSGTELDAFFQHAELLFPIRSRQVATSILLMADVLLKKEG